MIQIYKPTKNTTGAAISFQASDRDKHLYVNLIKQATWNAETKKGSFSENRGKPGKSTVLKFNQVEAGTIIDAIERFYEFRAFHSSPKNTTQISFGPAQPQVEGGEAPALFVFKVTQTDAQDTTQKASFFLPISYGEARLIKEYLIHYLHKSFRIPYNRPTSQASQVPAEEQQPAGQTEEQQPVSEETPETAGTIDW